MYFGKAICKQNNIIPILLPGRIKIALIRSHPIITYHLDRHIHSFIHVATSMQRHSALIRTQFRGNI